MQLFFLQAFIFQSEYSFIYREQKLSFCVMSEKISLFDVFLAEVTSVKRFKISNQGTRTKISNCSDLNMAFLGTIWSDLRIR